MAAIVDSPAIVEEEEVDIVPVLPATAFRFSWSAAIAGAFVATAITFIVISLGSGIGLSIASPYHVGPSATSLTVAGAVWLVMAQAFGFACGGYLAGRIRTRFTDDAGDEAKFRDAAHGLVVWALGVAVAVLVLGAAAIYPLRALSNASVTQTAAAASGQQVSAEDGVIGYFVDLVFRPVRTAPGQASSTASAPASDTRAEVTRIMAHAVAQGQLSSDDRAYLAQLVAQRTGVTEEEAARQVAGVENQARDAVKQAADKAVKAGAFISFWTFMSLLFGGAAAALGGMLGGESREIDGNWSPAVQLHR